MSFVDTRYRLVVDPIANWNSNYFPIKLNLNLIVDNDDCANCAGILEELENIDDDCDRHGIVFVKTKDFSIAEEYGGMVFYKINQ